MLQNKDFSNLMNINVLNLLFPQWQGSGISNELYFGAKTIENHFSGKIKFSEVAVSTETNVKTENGIFAYSSIVEQLNRACQIIEDGSPEKVLTIGGDCGVELAPVSFLNRQYSGDMAVIWLDAHGDLNTPEESLSHHFHGMPLRTLLGDGDNKIVESCFSTISPNQIILVGGRDYDQAEQEYIEKEKIGNFSVSQVSKDCRRIIELIQSMGFNNLYIHIDLDVLDPGYFPYVKCPTKNGLSFETLIKTISELKGNFPVVGLGIVEYVADGDTGIENIKELLQINGFL